MSSTLTATEVQLINQISLEQIVKVVYDEKVLDKNFTLITQILRELRNGLKDSKIQNEKQTKEIIMERDQNNEQNEILARLQKEFHNLKDDIGKSSTMSGDVWKEIKEIKENLSKCNEKANSGYDQSNKNQKDINWIIEELKNLQNRVKELENKSDYLMKKSDYNDKVADMERRVDAIEKQIENVKIDDLQQNMKVFEQESGDPSKDQANRKKTMEQLDITQNNIEHILKQINNLKIQIKKLENAQQQRNKNGGNSLGVNDGSDKQKSTDTSTFSDRTGLTMGENPEESEWSIQNRDQKLMQDLLKRLGILQEALKNLKYAYDQLVLKLNNNSGNMNLHMMSQTGDLGINSEDIDKMKADMVRMKNEMKKLSESSEKTRDLVNVHDHDISELKRYLENLNMQLTQLSAGGLGGGNINEQNLNNRLTALRNEILSRLKAIKKDLAEQYVTVDQLNDELAQIYGMFADKDETQKALASLEKRLNQMQNLVMMLLNEYNGGGEDDARGVKRPLQWTCLSCDQDIPGYKAKIGDFRPWSQLPSRYLSPEKLGTFGKQHVKLESIHKTGSNTKRSPSNEKSAVNYDI